MKDSLEELRIFIQRHAELWKNQSQQRDGFSIQHAVGRERAQAKAEAYGAVLARINQLTGGKVGSPGGIYNGPGGAELYGDGKEVDPVRTFLANSIFTIKPYKWEGTWVFDDQRVGLEKEAFVGGADDIIDALIKLKNIPDAERGFILQFSEHQFPGSEELTWRRQEMDGNVYEWNGMEGWLCPALLLYYPTPPLKLFATAKK
jgi:hypothetical protein